ncbi:hypothetical protein KIPB_013312, partial [Kipferlia bialata]
LSTVPNIYVGGEHIGGCDTLIQRLKAHTLDEATAAAQAMCNK